MRVREEEVSELDHCVDFGPLEVWFRQLTVCPFHYLFYNGVGHQSIVVGVVVGDVVVVGSGVVVSRYNLLRVIVSVSLILRHPLIMSHPVGSIELTCNHLSHP